MPKDTKTTASKKSAKTSKKANPVLEDEEVLEDEDTETETDEEEVEDETETDDDADADEETDEADEADEEDEEAEDDEEVEEEPVKKSAKASKTGAKSKAKAKDDGDNLIQRDAPKVRGANSIEAQMTQDAKETKAALAKQPKVRIFIPLGIGEKKGNTPPESVTINGYRMELPKGEYVTVPEGVAELIERHYNMSPENTEMGQRYRLDRTRTKDGMTTDEALN